MGSVQTIGEGAQPNNATAIDEKSKKSENESKGSKSGSKGGMPIQSV